MGLGPISWVPVDIEIVHILKSHIDTRTIHIRGSHTDIRAVHVHGNMQTGV